MPQLELHVHKITSWDVCKEKGHKWSGWIDYLDGKKWRKYRVCSVCGAEERK